MTNSENGKLLPCPFPRCGGEAEMQECANENISYRTYVRCKSCGCNTKWSKTEVGAITMWNTRPAQSVESVEWLAVRDDIAHQLFLHDYFCNDHTDDEIDELVDFILSKIQPDGKRYTQADLVKARKQGYDDAMHDRPIVNDFANSLGIQPDRRVEKALEFIEKRIISANECIAVCRIDGGLKAGSYEKMLTHKLNDFQKIQSTLKGES